MSAADVVIISSIDWNTLWQGPQETAVRLGGLGRKVLFVENTGVRALRLSDARRVAARLTRWGRTVTAPRTEVAPNVWLCSPLMLPPFGPRWQRAINRHVLVPRVRAAAQAIGLRNLLVWTFLPTDTALSLLDAFAPRTERVVYTCHADFSELTPDRRNLERCERELVRRSNTVFTNCSSLATRFRAWDHPHVQVLPNGVSLESFPIEEPRPGSTAPTPELTDRPRPIVGYVGGLHVQLAMDALVAMARARPQWTWAYVGPIQTDVSPLRLQPNVVLTGPKPHDRLAAYVRQFDVCTIPYLRNVYTDTVVPTKLNEYLAMGKPVVSTDLPALADTPALLREIRTAAPEPAAFLAALDATLSTPTTAADVQRRRQLAAAADWNARLDQMLALIEAPRSPTAAASVSNG